MKLKIKISIIFATVIFIVDSFIMNQGVIAAVTLFIVVFVSLPITFYRQYKKRDYKTSYIVCLIYVLSALLVFCANYVNNKIAHHRAEMLITKIEQYKIDHGSYPEKLQTLIPKYIDSIPAAKFSYHAKFYYYNSQGFTSIHYVAMPPFGRPFYDFKLKQWDYHD
ncbi:MAG: hypothetical protein QM504_04010 [Pseudomonadota bacterium]